MRRDLHDLGIAPRIHMHSLHKIGQLRLSGTESCTIREYPKNWEILAELGKRLGKPYSGAEVDLSECTS